MTITTLDGSPQCNFPFFLFFEIFLAVLLCWIIWSHLRFNQIVLPPFFFLWFQILFWSFIHTLPTFWHVAQLRFVLLSILLSSLSFTFPPPSHFLVILILKLSMLSVNLLCTTNFQIIILPMGLCEQAARTLRRYHSYNV